MHPITRLGRVIQQLTSFGDMHATELEAMAVDLEAAGAADLAGRLRLYRDVQRDEAQIVVDELVDLQADMTTAAQSTDPVPPMPAPTAGDPAINSPKRARWLAEQAAQAEKASQPLSRRDLLGRSAPPAEDQ